MAQGYGEVDGRRKAAAGIERSERCGRFDIARSPGNRLAMLKIRSFLFPPDHRGVAGLVVLGWRGTLAALLVAIVVSFLLAGYWYPYWRLADMDLMMAYQGFLVGSGFEQDFFIQPGHLSIILTSAWYELFHRLGLIDTLTLSQIPPPSDVTGFDHIWTQAVRAGRVLSLVEAMAFVVIFAALLRRLVRDWQIAALAAFCLAFSGGLMMNARTMRTDMLSAALVTIGLLLLLIAARSPQSTWRPVLVGVAATLCTLGIVNKVHSVFLVCALIPAIPFFGEVTPPQAFWRSAKAIAALGAVAVVGVTLAIPAGELITRGLSMPTSIPPPFGVRGGYQVLIAALVFAGILAYALIWRVPLAETLATMLAVVAGVALGLLSIKILYHAENVAVIVNPIEHMFGWAAGSDPKLRSSGSILLDLLHSLGNGVLDMAARRTFVLRTSGRPTIFIEWLVIAGLVLAWRRGRYRVFWQVLGLMGVVWAVDTVGTLRGLKLEYVILTDPLTIIAAAWLLAHFTEFKTHRFAFAVGIALIAVHVALSQAGPVKHVFRTAPAVEECAWMDNFAPRIERFSFCPPRPVRSPPG